MTVIGVAQFQRPFGHAMKAGEQRIGAEGQGGDGPFDRAAQGADIGRIVMIGRQRAHGRLPAHLCEGRKGRVIGSGGREHAIAWKLAQSKKS